MENPILLSHPIAITILIVSFNFIQHSKDGREIMLLLIAKKDKKRKKVL
jgi:hypothetical protein